MECGRSKILGRDTWDQPLFPSGNLLAGGFETGAYHHSMGVYYSTTHDFYLVYIDDDDDDDDDEEEEEDDD